MEQTYECNAIGLFVDCEFNEERPRAYKKGGQIRVVKCRKTFRQVGIANDARQGLVQEVLYGRRRFFKLDNALEKGWGKAGLSHSVP